MRWSLSGVVAATDAKPVGVSGDPMIEEVATDSRLVQPGALFVALHGERFNGHDFARQALEAGAVAVMVERGSALDEPRLEVADTGTALRDLGAAGRERVSVPVAAVTGSTGKTSTKDLLASALGAGTWAAPRSFNNEVGVPLTVLMAPDDAGAVVFEVGSRGPGHIAWLAPVVRPWVAVITNVGIAHMEMFGDLETIAVAKWELMEALAPGGVGVVPAAEPRLAGRRLSSRMTFGADSEADVTVEDLELDAWGRPSFRLRTPMGSSDVRLAVAGRHQALNAAAATAAALALGRGLEEVASGLEKTEGSPWRMEVLRGRFTIVNDVYNANPASMRSALETVARMPGRHLAVLGRMAELGEAAPEEHRRIGELASRLGFELLVVGDDPGLAQGFGETARSAPDLEHAFERLAASLSPGDVVLVKGSRVVGLELLVDRLVREAGP